MLYLEWNSKGEYDEIETISAFSTSPDFINLLELTKLAFKPKEKKIKSVSSDLFLDYISGMRIFRFMPEFSFFFFKISGL